MTLVLMIVPLIILIIIALTYDKTVTPVVDYFNNKSKNIDLLRSDSGDIKVQIKSEYRLYDYAIIVLPFGLCYLTYELFTSDIPVYYPGSSALATLWVWIVVLFKTHRIKIYDNNVLKFQGLLRTIDVNADQITEIQDWLSFVRVKFNTGSLILFPFVEKLGAFKAEVKSLNPEATIEDMSNMFFDSKYGIGLTLAGMVIFFGCMIVYLFYRFTHLQ